MSNPDSTEPTAIAVCTLADGDYFLGVGALANSLYRSGFRGTLWVGYRGPLPAWASQTVQREQRHDLTVADGFAISFVQVPDGDTLALAKPDFILRVLDELAPAARGAMFFDADIVVLGGWPYFQDWMEMGVGLCTENLPFKHTNHPHRRYWREMIAAIGRPARDQNLYFNSGFLSVPREHRDFTSAWSQLIAEYRRRVGQSVPGIRFGDKMGPLWATDQEMLNAAAMATQAPLSILGPEGMDFAPLGLYMSHAIGRKPWHASYFLEALLANRPASADRHFWNFMDRPIAVVSSFDLARRRVALKIASGIGRFYSR